MGTPASASSRSPTIWLSLNFDFRMTTPDLTSLAKTTTGQNWSQVARSGSRNRGGGTDEALEVLRGADYVCPAPGRGRPAAGRRTLFALTAVRVAGSWVAAIGLQMLGWAIRGRL